jgi:hypothetical protein
MRRRAPAVTLPEYQMAVAGKWALYLAVGLTCPFCDCIVQAHNAKLVDRTRRRFRITCANCKRPLIELTHATQLQTKE